MTDELPGADQKVQFNINNVPIALRKRFGEIQSYFSEIHGETISQSRALEMLMESGESAFHIHMDSHAIGPAPMKLLNGHMDAIKRAFSEVYRSAHELELTEREQRLALERRLDQVAAENSEQTNRLNSHIRELCESTVLQKAETDEREQELLRENETLRQRAGEVDVIKEQNEALIEERSSLDEAHSAQMRPLLEERDKALMMQQDLKTSVQTHSDLLKSAQAEGKRLEQVVTDLGEEGEMLRKQIADYRALLDQKSTELNRSQQREDRYEQRLMDSHRAYEQLATIRIEQAAHPSTQQTAAAQPPAADVNGED